MGKATNYVIINNRAYDPITGLPVDDAPRQPVASASAQSSPAAKEQSAPRQRGIATSRVYRSPLQRSTTLSRRHVQRPAASAPRSIVAARTSHAARTASPVSQSAAIQKFSPASAPSEAPKVRPDRVAETHPVVRRAATRARSPEAPRQQRRAVQQKLDTQQKLNTAPVQPTIGLKPAEVLKNEAILAAMNKEIDHKKSRRPKAIKHQSRFGRFVSFAMPSLAVALLAGYFTYLSMPQLSIRMAAIQSGINAKYPGYSPNGYSLSGPIAFKDGEVTMKFAYADNSQGYTINQVRSSWDSAAVKEFVASQTKDATTTVADGLTIYTYGSNAAWVNSGVFYTLKGDAPLSSDQITRIATSM